MRNQWRSPIVLTLVLGIVALGVGVAHAKGFQAGHVVTLISREASPERTATPSQTSQPTTQTFQLTGGTVTVTCANGVITVNDATPNAGFTVKQEVQKQGAEVEVRFESATHESRLEVSCDFDAILVEEQREEAVEQPAPAAQPTTPPQSSSRTFALVGGTVSVTCTGNALTVNSVVPNPGFSVEEEMKDEEAQLEVRFENDAHRSRLEVGCSAGQVVVEELREESH